MANKNIILLVSGVADTFFSEGSRRQLAYTNNLDTRIADLIKDNDHKIYGYLDVLSSSDQRKQVQLFKDVRKQRVISLRLNGTQIIDVENDFALTEQDGSALHLKGTEFDHILRPQDYEIHICGVDLHGIYKSAIPQLLEAGYKVCLYSDMIKRYRDAEEHIKSIRNRNFEYCSSKLALSRD